MSYKILLAELVKWHKELKRYASEKGWHGKDIRDVISKRESWKYIRLCGQIEGMRTARKLTIRELRKSVKK